MYLKVTLLGEASVTSWVFAHESAAVVHGSVVDIDMCPELALSLANETTLKAEWWVYRLDVVLEFSMRDKSYSAWCILCYCCIGGQSFRSTQIAPESIAGMFFASVCDQCRGVIELPATHLTSVNIDVIADIRLVVEMNADNVSVKRLLFPKVLLTRRVTSTFELFVLLVSLLVVSVSLSRGKCLAAAWPLAKPVALVLVKGLDVVFEVAVPHERFVATFMLTNERTFVCMRALVFLQSYRTIVGFSTAWKVANVAFRSRAA